MPSDHHRVSASRNTASTSSRIAGSISSNAEFKKEPFGVSIRRRSDRTLIAFLDLSRPNAFVIRRSFAPTPTAPYP
jgi:hypothetical protein